MPNPLLAPLPLDDGPKTTDPAADLAAYLIGGRGTRGEGTRGRGRRLARVDIRRCPSPLIPRPHLPRPPRHCQAGLFWLPRHPRLRGCRTDRSHVERLGPKARIAAGVRADRRVHQTASRPADGTSADGTPGLNSDDGFFRDALLGPSPRGLSLAEAAHAAELRLPGGQPASPFDEQLKMGRFELTDAQREAIITFILGLADETPAAKYVYQPDRQRKAIIEGRKVLDKYACAECHTLGLERWTIDGEDRACRACRGSSISGAVAAGRRRRRQAGLLLHALGAGHDRRARVAGGRGRRGGAQGPIDGGPAALGRNLGPAALSGGARPRPADPAPAPRRSRPGAGSRRRWSTKGRSSGPSGCSAICLDPTRDSAGGRAADAAVSSSRRPRRAS